MMYAMVGIGLNIAFIIKVVSRFMSNMKKKHREGICERH